MKQRPTLRGVQLLLLALAVVLVVLGFLTLSHRATISTSELAGQQKSGVGALTLSPVTQVFFAAEDGLSEVTVSASNYNKKLENGALTLTLTDEAGQVLATQDFPVSEIKKTQSSVGVTLALPSPVAASAGRAYTLAATSDCTEGKGITLKTGELEAPDAAQVLTLQDGTAQTDAVLMLKMTYTGTQLVWNGSYTLWLLALCVLCCLPLAGKEGKNRA